MPRPVITEIARILLDAGNEASGYPQGSTHRVIRRVWSDTNRAARAAVLEKHGFSETADQVRSGERQV